MLGRLSKSDRLGAVSKLPAVKRAQALQMMAEGICLRSITRLTDISRTTLIKLLEDAGAAFSAYQGETLVNLNCRRVQVDEAWEPICASPRRISSGSRRVTVLSLLPRKISPTAGRGACCAGTGPAAPPASVRSSRRFIR